MTTKKTTDTKTPRKPLPRNTTDDIADDLTNLALTLDASGSIAAVRADTTTKLHALATDLRGDA